MTGTNSWIPVKTLGVPKDTLARGNYVKEGVLCGQGGTKGFKATEIWVCVDLHPSSPAGEG